MTFDRTLLDSNKYEGFRLNNTIPEQVPNVVETGTTIKVYYVKVVDITVIVNHYLTNTNGNEATLKDTTTITGVSNGTTINGENYRRNYDGYTYYLSEPETIVASQTNNVINLYYRANISTKY